MLTLKVGLVNIHLEEVNRASVTRRFDMSLKYIYSTPTPNSQMMMENATTLPDTCMQYSAILLYISSSSIGGVHTEPQNHYMYAKYITLRSCVAKYKLLSYKVILCVRYML